jgi:hypothetical protein
MMSAQSVGIGTNTPNVSAALDITSTTKGFLIPRMTFVQRIALVSPATGLQVYQIDGTKGFYYFDGTIWSLLSTTGGGWSLTGNTDINGSGNFIGTTDLKPFVGKANGEQVFRFAPNSNNTTIGYQASHADYSGGTYSHIIGYKAGYTNSGSFAHLDGYQAGFNNTGNSNQFIGYNTGYTNNAGSNNLFIGSACGYSNTTGSNNEFFGYQAGYKNTINNENQFFGHQAGFNNAGDFNFFSGLKAGYANTTGSENFFDGYKAGISNVTGYKNHFSGYGAGFSNTSNENHFVGFQAGFYNTSGYRNQFEGYEAGHNNTTGKNNVFSGYHAGFNSVSSINNTFVGFETGYNHYIGHDNTFIGFQAGYNNSKQGSVFIGAKAGFDELSDYRLHIGNESTFSTPLIYGEFNNYLFRVNGSAQITKVSNSTSPVLELTENSQIWATLRFKKSNYPAGSWDINAYVDPNNQVFAQLLFKANGQDQMLLYGNGDLTVWGDVYENSDSILKKNIQPLQNAIPSLMKINPVTYNWKSQHKDKDTHIGFLAQEVEQAFPQLVKTDQNGTKSVSYTHMVPVLLEAIKEQQAEMNTMKDRIDQLEAMVVELVNSKK